MEISLSFGKASSFVFFDFGSLSIISSLDSTAKEKKRNRKMFRFESMWFKDSRCEKVVKDAWERGQLVGSDWVLQECLEQCKIDLSALNDSKFGHVGRTNVELQTKLEWLELQPISKEIVEALRHTRIELNCWLDREDDMWRQRSRINWLDRKSVV